MINRFTTHRTFIFPLYLTLGHPSVTKRSVLAILLEAEAIYGPSLAKSRSGRIESDWQNTVQINNEIPAKSRGSPDNVLNTGKVEFCAFLSCVVVSSFIETFLSCGIDLVRVLQSIRCDLIQSGKILSDPGFANGPLNTKVWFYFETTCNKTFQGKHSKSWVINFQVVLLCREPQERQSR